MRYSVAYDALQGRQSPRLYYRQEYYFCKPYCSITVLMLIPTGDIHRTQYKSRVGQPTRSRHILFFYRILLRQFGGSLFHGFVVMRNRKAAISPHGER